MRKRVIAGNWKMHKTAAEAVEYTNRFIELSVKVPRSVELVICPPFTALNSVSQVLASHDGRVKLGAQNMHWMLVGAFTGQISASMLVELGVQYVIVGHSECREYFGETDQMVEQKVRTALESGLTPIIAVGETLDVRNAGNAEPYVVAQTRAALGEVGKDYLHRVILAYEPIWAIGTGHNCDPVSANAVMKAMRESRDGLSDVPILYGGSVKPENIAHYMAQPDIDGGLVGGASLDPAGFATLATEAA